ncbi:MAG: hypothetical protein H6812_05570 [Phycisphaeraceae bacterium]|nr:hypothetical protein [Phycisphaerales bacterium]MCB9842711.1 hypothetical protein [Phycisphaeraceae bacterium]
MPGPETARLLLAAEPGQTPAWAIWLFEKPVATAIVLIIASFIVFTILSKRGRARASWIALSVGVLLAAGAFLTARMVTTDREHIAAGARAFVAAVARTDTRQVSNLLDDRLVVTVNGSIAPYVDKDRVVTAASTLGHYGIRRASTRIDAVSVQRAGSGKADIGVLVTTESAGNATSTWTLEWRKGPDGSWRITALDWRTINGQSPSLSMLLNAK